MKLDDILFWLGHASFYIETGSYTIFIDPFRVPGTLRERADLILVTHAHFDHCSKDDINKVMKKETRIIAAPGCLSANEYKNLTVAEPGFKSSLHGINIEAVPAYNIRSERLQFHPKANRWVGYVVDANGMRIYHAGDTDLVPEMRNLSGIYAALLPVGGTYTMAPDEAVEAASVIKPKFFVPMHYKNILGREGSKNAEERLMKELDNCHIMKEVQEPSYSF